MKRIIIIAICLLTFNGMAQDKSEINNTKHEVVSFVVELYSLDWYKNQQKLWKSELDQHKKNEKAWYNYYMATRAIRHLEKDKGLKEELSELLTQIAKDGYKQVPNTFEGNMLMYKGTNYSETKYLFKAYELSPKDSRTYGSMMVEAEFLVNDTDKEKFAKLMFQNNLISNGILNWGYNLLSGLDSNAILITHGDNDTYGAWLNQAGNKYRNDVIVLNSYMLTKSSYRKKVFKKLGMEDQFVESPKTETQEAWEQGVSDNIKKLIEHSGRPFYVTNTHEEYMFGGKKDDCYLTGLNYKYSKDNIDNTSIIRNNIENRYKLDYIDVSFQFDVSQKIVDRSHSQYLTAFIKLHNHYMLSGELTKAAKLKVRILKIAKLNNYLEKVQSQLMGKC